MKTYLIALLCLLGLGAGSAYGSGIGGGGSGGGGGGPLPATVAYTTSTLPFTVNQTVAASMTVTGANGLLVSSTATIKNLVITGSGAGASQLTEGTDTGVFISSPTTDNFWASSDSHAIVGTFNASPSTYTFVVSSVTPVAGQCGQWTPSGPNAWTLGTSACGIGGTPAGGKGAVQFSSAGVFGGNNNFQWNGTSMTIISSVTITNNGQNNATVGFVDIFKGSPDQAGYLFTIGSTNDSNQVYVPDEAPMRDLNGFQGYTLVYGNTANKSTIYSGSVSNLEGINFGGTENGNTNGRLRIETEQVQYGGADIMLSPNTVNILGVSVSSVTISTVTVFTALATPITTDGSFWNDSTQKSFKTQVAGSTQIINQSLWTMTVSSSINTTATEGEIISTKTTSGVGTLNLPANFFTAGKSIYLVLSGTYTTTGTPSLDIKIKLSTTTILDTGVVTQVAVTGTDVFTLSAHITCRTTGTVGTVMATGQTVQNTNTIGSTGMDLNSTLTTIDTTIAEPIKVTVTWGASSSSNNLTFTNGFIEVKN